MFKNSIMQQGLEFTPENIAVAAKLTFGNVVLITFLFGSFDYLRRKFMVDRPVKMVQELSGTETLRTDFIANVSHKLKTPLAVMGNYATMFQRPGISEEERRKYAKAISEAARKLAQLITNILKLNRLENQQIFPTPQEFDLGEQLCESLLGFEDAWEAKNLEIETDIQDDVHIQSDPELLSLVWNNLISNAVKFTPSGARSGSV